MVLVWTMSVILPVINTYERITVKFKKSDHVYVKSEMTMRIIGNRA